MEAPKRRNDEQKASARQFAPSLLHRFSSVKGGPKAAALAFCIATVFLAFPRQRPQFQRPIT
jgi:hypothetical protein